MAAYLLAFFVFFLGYWINRYFGKPDLDQIIYHLSFGVDGISSSDPIFIRRFIQWCIVTPLILFAATRYVERSGVIGRWIATRRSNVAGRLLAALAKGLPYLLLLAALILWLVQVSAFRYVAANFGPDYFSSHYVPPAKVKLREHGPKNLVLIYVESLENSYSDKALFGSDMLAPLNRLGGVGFSRFRQAPGTGWTIAALVASQCGIPLKRVTVYDENTQGEVLSHFLPNATCLSDILTEHGYRNVFMGGGSPGFAGKGKFLRTHHYQEILGKEDWERQGADSHEMNGWGLYDSGLFARAKEKLRTLENEKTPFNLTLLTVDTHEPRGYLSDYCAARGYHGFEDIVKCTAEEVEDFVRYIRESGYLANTNVVVLGDHLARKNPVTDKLASIPERHIFTSFISSHPPTKNREDIVHFDLLPTILEFNGFDVPGERLGLGYSAFYKPEAVPPPDRFDEMQHALMNRSEAYMSLWTEGAQH